MKKYSIEWKMKKRVWVQDHKNERWGKIYKIHIIRNATEYSFGEYQNRKDAEQEMKNF